MIYSFYLSLGVSFTWVQVCLSDSRVWQPVLRSVSLVMPVCVVQHSSLVCSSVWSWFSSSPRCWVSTVWLWPFTCTRNKSINSTTTHTQHVDKTAQQSTRRTTLTTTTTSSTTMQVKSVSIIYHPTRITNKQNNTKETKWTRLFGGNSGGRLYIEKTKTKQQQSKGVGCQCCTQPKVADQCVHTSFYFANIICYKSYRYFACKRNSRVLLVNCLV